MICKQVFIRKVICCLLIVSTTVYPIAGCRPNVTAPSVVKTPSSASVRDQDKEYLVRLNHSKRLVEMLGSKADVSRPFETESVMLNREEMKSEILQAIRTYGGSSYSWDELKVLLANASSNGEVSRLIDSTDVLIEKIPTLGLKDESRLVASSTEVKKKLEEFRQFSLLAQSIVDPMTASVSSLVEKLDKADETFESGFLVHEVDAFVGVMETLATDPTFSVRMKALSESFASLQNASSVLQSNYEELPEKEQVSIDGALGISGTPIAPGDTPGKPGKDSGMGDFMKSIGGLCRSESTCVIIASMCILAYLAMTAPAALALAKWPILGLAVAYLLYDLFKKDGKGGKGDGGGQGDSEGAGIGDSGPDRLIADLRQAVGEINGQPEGSESLATVSDLADAIPESAVAFPSGSKHTASISKVGDGFSLFLIPNNSLSEIRELPLPSIAPKELFDDLSAGTASIVELNVADSNAEVEVLFKYAKGQILGISWSAKEDWKSVINR